MQYALRLNSFRPRSGLERLRLAIGSRLEDGDLGRTCLDPCWSCDEQPQDAAMGAGNCVSRLAVLVGALRLWDMDARVALRELHAAWRHSDEALSLTARGVLAQLGEPAALEATIADLDDPERASTALMQIGAAGVQARPYAHRLILRFEGSIEESRWMYLHVLGAIGGSLAINALRRELAKPYGAHDQAVLALQELGQDARDARAELEVIASEHPSAWTRELARTPFAPWASRLPRVPPGAPERSSVKRTRSTSTCATVFSRFAPSSRTATWSA
jgi:hypothetical protein